MNEEKISLRMMPWKYRLAFIFLSISNIGLSLLVFDLTILAIKGFMIVEILLIASCCDIRLRIVPDWIHVLILLVGLIEFELVKSFVGLVIAPLPFLFIALVNEGSIGGGDVKLVGAMGFALGIERIYFINISSLLLCIIVLLIKNNSKNTFPFAPYLAAGVIIEYIWRLMV